ncbi:hypothetical protein C8R34_1398 [Nitrosomonas sp. Nm84]|uniref:hypothetical protein n=1 Tax=Nitrosomonas sp. Nm84 TaxID=200124 RepID=UPI000D8CCE53|nr:hypothetical protein [Nitrosomonas sp. Nm84]PXW81378.1 hypothetical protein C8R34_1398 [Nitrosomonas sp. Nm84]
MSVKVPILLMPSSHLNSRALPITLLVIGVLFLSILSGIFAAFGNVILLIALLALYGLFFVLAVPAGWTVWIIFLAAFLITGPSAYFIRFSQLQWFTVLVSAALLLPVLLHLLRSKASILAAPISKDFFWPVTFLLLITFSTVIDQPKFSEFVNASRHYLFMWPLMLVFMLGLVRQEMLVQLWKALMVVAVMQLPMAIYQYFFVAQKSVRLSPWDAVIGTFQGAIEGGGDSAAMAIMLLIAMLTAIALWHGKKLHGMWMMLIVVTSLGTIALAEVKAAVMLLPIVIGLYYRKELLRRPIESVVVMIGALLLVGGIFMVYEKLHYGEISTHTFNKNQATSTYDRVMRALSPETESSSGHQLGRINHLVNWWDINVMSGDIQHSLFGYGMGATYTSRVGAGELVNRFSYQVNTSSSTILLWETGILGHLVFLLVLLSGVQVSSWGAKNGVVPEIHRIFLRVGAIGLLLLAITLPYKSFHFYSNPIQFLMMFMLGQAAYWSRFIKSYEKMNGL